MSSSMYAAWLSCRNDCTVRMLCKEDNASVVEAWRFLVGGKISLAGVLSSSRLRCVATDALKTSVTSMATR